MIFSPEALDKLGEYKRIINEIKLTLLEESGLDHISHLLQICKHQNIWGAFVETGVWRGGACIWARAIMDELDNHNLVYVCDSFEGLPRPTYDEDAGDIHYTHKELGVSLEAVKENFSYFELRGEVVFVKGWFKDTMPKLKKEIGDIAILRLDGDMYESTIQVLENLYDKVVPNGFIIIDDWCLDGARRAVIDFRKKNNITSQLYKINKNIYHFQKP